MRTGPNTNGMSRAVQRPGIDPRINLALAVVTQLGFDATHGMFADVQFSSGELETCLVGAAYAGEGFGMWGPLRVDDTVLVGIPMGDPGLGPTIIARMWNAADAPHADFKATEQDDGSDVPTEDFVLRVQPGKKLKLRTSDGGGDLDIQVEGDGTVNIEGKGSGAMKLQQTGTGNIYIHAASGQKVYVGAETGTQPMVMGTDHNAFQNAFKTWATTHTHGETGVNTSTPNEPFLNPVPQLSTKVENG